jgi:hypothetical protein
MTRTFDRRTRRLAALAGALFLALAAPGGGPGPAVAAAEPGANEVTLFLGRDFSSPSRSWALPDGQPFLAVPYVGRDYAGIMAGAKVGAEVGVVLFEGPFFQAADQTCDYQLGSAQAPDLWWLSPKTRVLPAGAEAGAVNADVSATPAASLIVYRRALGPPPGALLLERTRTIDWNCDKPTKARTYKRLFVPIPQAPHTLGCFNMAASLTSPEREQVSLDFTAASELALLLPADAGGHYGVVEHRLSATLYDAENCEGASVAVAHPQSEGRHFDLRDLGFNRKARSLLLSYDGGAYDDYLPPLSQRPEAPAVEIAKAPAAETAAPEPVEEAPSTSLTATLAEQEGAALAAAPAAETAAPEPTAEEPSASLTATLAEQEDTAAAAPAAETAAPEPAAEEPSASLTATLAEQEGAAAAAPAAESAAPEPTAEEPSASLTATLAEQEGAAAAEPPEPEPLEPEPTSAPSTSLTKTLAEQEGAAATDAASLSVGGDIAGEDPEAPETVLLLPAQGTPETTDSSRTFQFPLVQGYRLSACKFGKEDCGEPAANAWCQGQGFQRAADWKIDENVGSLFPTLAIGDFQLCADFVCDSFEEITCAQ